MQWFSLLCTSVKCPHLKKKQQLGFKVGSTREKNTGFYWAGPTLANPVISQGKAYWWWFLVAFN